MLYSVHTDEAASVESRGDTMAHTHHHGDHGDGTAVHVHHHHGDGTAAHEHGDAATSHEDRSFAHIHTHRNLIGFDENDVSTVIVAADHGEDDDDPQAFIRDYNEAIRAYRKTFPTKDEVAEKTPDPAVCEMIHRMNELGLETTFHRFDAQQPQCGFGLAGTCCKICNMGPCRITPKAPRGV